MYSEYYNIYDKRRSNVLILQKRMTVLCFLEISIRNG